MADTIEMISQRIQDNKNQIRILKQRMRTSSDADEIKQISRQIQNHYIDIRNCRRERALEASIGREFDCIAIDD